jgi:hypothetical protein
VAEGTGTILPKLGEVGSWSAAYTVKVAVVESGHALFWVTVVWAVESMLGSDPVVFAAVSSGSAPDLINTVEGIGIMIPCA